MSRREKARKRERDREAEGREPKNRWERDVGAGRWTEKQKRERARGNIR